MGGTVLVQQARSQNIIEIMALKKCAEEIYQSPKFYFEDQNRKSFKSENTIHYFSGNTNVEQRDRVETKQNYGLPSFHEAQQTTTNEKYLPRFTETFSSNNNSWSSWSDMNKTNRLDWNGLVDNVFWEERQKRRNQNKY